MPMREFKSSGRELMIKFSCYRCDKIQYEPYSKVMTGEHYDYLSNSVLPDGWSKVGYSTILCPECTNAYKLFMGG